MKNKWFSLAFAIVCGICIVISIWLIIDDYRNDQPLRWINVLRLFLFVFFCWTNTQRYLERRKAE
ncbi:MAG TPA: hypothetical protein VK183_05970 [Flavobacterium sp.]|nr:hypothetical protein [Flavobacterium sp.]